MSSRGESGKVRTSYFDLQEYLKDFSDDSANKVLDLLETLAGNISRCPDVLKYRQVRDTNKRVQMIPGALDAMRISGWQSSKDLLVFPEDRISSLATYLAEIGSLREWLQEREESNKQQQDKNGAESECLRLRLQHALSAAAKNGHLQSCLKAATGDEADAVAQEARTLAQQAIQRAIAKGSTDIVEKAEIKVKAAVKAKASSVQEPPIQMEVADIQTSFELSKGEFGSSRVAVSTRDIDQQVDRIYAWKRTSKSKVLLSQRMKNMYVEKHALTKMSHPFVVRLFGYAQDSLYLYLCLEPWEAGNLKHHLQVAERFDDDRARFYTASVILALRYIHSMGIVYRNVDLESVVMRSNGYVKLGDFSLAKLTKPDREELEVPDTMPEVVLRGPSGFANTPADLLPKDTHVDWWMLAILIYEMIVGRPPVVDAGAQDKRDYQKTWNGQSAIYIPRYFRAPARSLMKKLLHLELDDVDVIMLQSWFAGFDFEALEMQKMSAPWRPQKEVELFSARLRAEPFQPPDREAEGVEQRLAGRELAWLKDW